MSNLDKDIEILKEFENYSPYEEIGETGKQAIKNVLTELETYKKIAEKLAEELDKITEDIAREKGIEDFEFCNERCHNEDDYIDCTDCIIDWARKEVEKDD